MGEIVEHTSLHPNTGRRHSETWQRAANARGDAAPPRVFESNLLMSTRRYRQGVLHVHHFAYC